MITIRLLLSLSRGLTVLMSQPVSLQSESTDYDFSSGRVVRATTFCLDPEQNTLITAQSPITFAPSLDCRSEPDFGAATSDSRAEAEPPKEQKKREPAKYSSTFKLGFYLSVHLCFSMLLLLV